MRAVAIQLEDLTRTFDAGATTVKALDRVNLTIQAGEMVALLGENGAGKTTLAKILATLLSPSSGTARVFGNDVVEDGKKVRKDTTVILGGDRGLYGMLDAVDNLRCFGTVHGVSRRTLRSRIKQVLQQVGLEEAAQRHVRTYSKGMKQRLHIAIGLLTEPRLLLLDEPTVGLDPNEATRLRETIANMHQAGTTVLLTSHNLADIDRLAERVLFLRNGALTHDLTLAEFRSLSGRAGVVTAQIEGPPRSNTRAVAAGDIVETSTGYSLSMAVPRWNAETLRLLAQALDGAQIVDLRIRETSLDEAFAAVTGAQDSLPATPRHIADQ